MYRIAQLAWNALSLIRFLLKLGITFSLLFALCIALIRAQPYDDSELRAFLTPPEGCPAPCFMGIRPGVTTVDEAVAILEAHEWVEPVYNDYSMWRWMGLQPDLIAPTVRGVFSIDNRNGRVAAVRITSNVEAGYLYLLYGNADSISAYQTSGIVISAFYFDHYLEIHAFGGSCPLTYYEFWNTTTSIVFNEYQSDLPFFGLDGACR